MTTRPARDGRDGRARAIGSGDDRVTPGARGSDPGASGNPSDVDLVPGTRTGEVAALGALLERHRAGIRAVAVSLLGNAPDADDAVQDASLIALRRIGDLRQPDRQPDSVGGWLRVLQVFAAGHTHGATR